MNPSSYSGREIDNRGIYRWLALLSIAFLAAAIVIVWLFAGPKFADNHGLAVMILWIAAVLLAVTGIVVMFRASLSRLRYINYLQRVTVVMTAVSALITIIGAVAAFLTGDKFDVLRAGIVSIILIAIGYPRRRHWKNAGY